MSRFCGEDQVAPVLEAADTWKDRCLLGRSALFSDDSLWNKENLNQLDEYFVQRLDWGEGSFLGKLERQLSPCTDSAKILCAEMMWVMLLAPNNITPEKKRENINVIMGWADSSIADSHPLFSDEVLKGIGSAGIAYNNLRWKELVYFIRLLQAFYGESATEKQALLSDLKRFAEWLEGIEDNESRQLRHMLLFLLFPDSCERVFAGTDRIKIVKEFTGKKRSEVKKMSAREIDEHLSTIRANQQREYETQELDWYVPPLKALWQDTSKSKRATEGADFYPILVTFLEQANTTDLKTRDYPATHLGLNMRVSFGAGNTAHVAWIAFLSFGQTPTKGIYPVFLYYKQDNLLILARGMSAANVPEQHWEGDELVSIQQYFQENYSKDPIRYGDSYVYEVYDLNDFEPDQDKINSDLSDLITEYKELMGESVEEEPESAYRPDVRENDSQKITVEEAMDGVFMDRSQIDNVIETLRAKKNVVLQGPPGVGKTFVSKRIAYALMGAKAKDRVELIQFHQTYSYEDFVQGYRPSDAGFDLKNGVFHQFCTKAAKDPSNPYVFVIDEINRGNLSKIFGELMMLIESDKRGADWAVPLTYSKDLNEKFFVPENVYIIGLMNTADRSLALVDYALRRRFAFFDLEPELQSEGFLRHLIEAGASEYMVTKIISRITALNSRISADETNLGPGFRIGHSFFCAAPANGVFDDLWFEQIIRYEVAPLLHEYWFDDRKTAEDLISELLA